MYICIRVSDINTNFFIITIISLFNRLIRMEYDSFDNFFIY